DVTGAARAAGATSMTLSFDSAEGLFISAEPFSDPLNAEIWSEFYRKQYQEKAGGTYTNEVVAALLIVKGPSYQVDVPSAGDAQAIANALGGQLNDRVQVSHESGSVYRLLTPATRPVVIGYKPLEDRPPLPPAPPTILSSATGHMRNGIPFEKRGQDKNSTA